MAKVGVSSSKTKKSFKAIFRRYWYWFVTIPVLIAVTFVWLYFLGIFKKEERVVLKTSSAVSIIEMPIDGMYHLVVTASNGKKPTYSSSDDSIVEVQGDGFLIARKEGIATVTAAVDEKKLDVTVMVSAPVVRWFMTTGDSFVDQDVVNAFPVTDLRMPEFILDQSSDETEEGEPIYFIEQESDSEMGSTRYRIKENIPDNLLPSIITFFNSSEGGKSEKRGIIHLWLYSTEEKKKAAEEAYQKTLLANKQDLPTVPKDRVDEERVFDCNSVYQLLPDVKTEGMVSFTLEGDYDKKYDDFPVQMLQSGFFRIGAWQEEFFITAIVGDEVYRYKCSSVPAQAYVTLSLGEEFLFSENEGTIPSEIVALSKPSTAQLQEMYDEEDKLIGYRAEQVTRNGTVVYVYGSPLETKVYYTFRLSVEINDPINTGEEEEGGLDEQIE